MNTSYEEIAKVIRTKKNIAIFGHQRPDGDAVGSTLGLMHLIQSNHDAQVTPHILDDIPESLSFLPGFDAFSSQAEGEYDLLIVVDTANRSRSGLADEIIAGTDTMVIDHHGTNELYGVWNHVDDSKTSVTHILASFAQSVGWNVSKEAATCLLTGIYTDSGCFIHRNTNGETFEIASWLTSQGACPSEIARHVFKSSKFEFQKNLGALLGTMRLYGDVNFCSMLGFEESTGKELKTALVSTMNSIQGVRYACVLTQDGDDIRGSLRTNHDDVDVADMASTYGGGGHTKASGFDFPAQLSRDEDGNDIVTVGDNIYDVATFIESLETRTPLT